ncbi:unnamed protein product [Symbiodinium natans]|uniref:Uncharacterized protein n=1 Tax=Symbiodinium natans TaxID=878477 RepID=A0A812ICV0_9DINO|nr:unnamed protein product [Symbiodinium natans]
MRLGEWLPSGKDKEGKEPADLLPLVIYSDFEVDDLMAIAQIWEWKLERLGLKGSKARPVIICAADFVHKDGCTVFEKKLLMARLMLGLEPCRDFQIICPDIAKCDATVRPLAESVLSCRASSLAALAEEINQVASGESDVDFYIIAPGRGQLGDVRLVMSHLSKLSPQFSTVETRYPSAFERLCKSAHVVMYTGSFNTTGTQPRDLEYLCKVAQSKPLIDISKFIFFGRADADPVTASADSFASPTLAMKLSEASELLPAAIVLFAEEFQGNLIRPTSWTLFRGHTLTEEETKRFQETIAPLADSGPFQKYAEALMNDPLFQKVASYKQSTVKAFALGTCDAPLCDEVCFLFEWCLANCPESLLDAQGDGGEWWIDPENGFSGIATEAHPAPERARRLGVRALQPSMKDPKDQAFLQKMRDVLEEYVLKHMDSHWNP